MACETNESREPLPVIAEPPYRCIYVGKGPSFSHALDHLDFGDLATVNDTAAALPVVAAGASVVAFCDSGGWHRKIPVGAVQRIVLPSPVSHADAEGIDAHIYAWGHVGSMARSSVTEAIEKRQPTQFGTPGPSGVVGLWLMGYKQIWLFGQDGGTGRSAEFETNNADYQNRRDAIEFMVPLLAERGCEVKFWPEGW